MLQGFKKRQFFYYFLQHQILTKLFENDPFNYFWQVVLYCPEGRVKSPIGYTKFMSCLIFKKAILRLFNGIKIYLLIHQGRCLNLMKDI